MLVYLHELDSALQDQDSLKNSIVSFLEEIFINGNTVVLSLNQFADSRMIKTMISDDEIFEKFRLLLENGYVKIDYTDNSKSEIETKVSITQYLIDCLEHEDHIFTSLPIENGTDDFEIVRAALIASDVTLLEQLSDSKISEMKRFVKLMTYMSLEEKYKNISTKKKTNKDYGFPFFIKCLTTKQLEVFDSEFKLLLDKALSEIIKIEKELAFEKKSKRSKWYRAIRENTELLDKEFSTYSEQYEENSRVDAMCLEIINVCSLLHIEQNIDNIVHHCDLKDTNQIAKEIEQRIYNNYLRQKEVYFSANPIRRDIDPKIIDNVEFSSSDRKNFFRIVNILDKKNSMKSHRKIPGIDRHKRFEQDINKTYEEQIEFQKKQIRKDYKSLALKNIAGLISYFIIFMLVQYLLDLLPIHSLFNAIPSVFLRHVIELFVTAMLSSFVSLLLNLPDGFVSLQLLVKTIINYRFYYSCQYRGSSFKMVKVK